MIQIILNIKQKLFYIHEANVVFGDSNKLALSRVKKAFTSFKVLDDKFTTEIDALNTKQEDLKSASTVLSIKTDSLFSKLDQHITDVTEASKAGKGIEIGRGKIDFPALVRMMREVNYTGVCSLEFEKDMKDPFLGIAESIGYFKAVSDLA